jgi:hypothetical protein
MTTEKHDPWALLREAKRLIAANRLMLGHYSGVREVGSLEDRIDAALAEAQDFAKSEMESDGFYQDETHRTQLGKKHILIRRLGVTVWHWDVCIEEQRGTAAWGVANTLAEAKSAAIAAARGMR